MPESCTRFMFYWCQNNLNVDNGRFLHWHVEKLAFYKKYCCFHELGSNIFSDCRLLLTAYLLHNCLKVVSVFTEHSVLHALVVLMYSAPVRMRKHCKSRRIFMLCLVLHACIVSISIYIMLITIYSLNSDIKSHATLNQMIYMYRKLLAET